MNSSTSARFCFVGSVRFPLAWHQTVNCAWVPRCPWMVRGLLASEQGTAPRGSEGVDGWRGHGDPELSKCAVAAL